MSHLCVVRLPNSIGIDWNKLEWIGGDCALVQLRRKLYLKSHTLDWIGRDRAVVQMRRKLYLYLYPYVFEKSQFGINWWRSHSCARCIFMCICICIMYLKSHTLDWIGGDRAVVQMRRRRWMLRRLQTWWTSLLWTMIVLTKIVDNECGGLRSCGQKSFASI